MIKKIEWINRGMTANNGLHMQEICDQIADATGIENILQKPETAPENTQLVAVDNTNTQTMLNIGDGLSVENGSLKASGGTGEKKYFHQIALFDEYNRLAYYFNLVTTTPKFNNGDEAFNEVPVNTYISCAYASEGEVLTSFPIIAGKESNGIFLASLDLSTKAITHSHYSHLLELLHDNSVEI